MSRAIGIDIVEFARIKNNMNEAFINRILSSEERSIFDSFGNEKRKVEFLAGRFAAKEAYSKLYKRFETSLLFTEVKVLKDEFGAPYIVSKYHPEDSIQVSISHSENYAVAICMKE